MELTRLMDRARIVPAKAREGKKEEMFVEPSEDVQVRFLGYFCVMWIQTRAYTDCTLASQDCRDCLDAVEWELQELLEECRTILKRPKLEYTSVAEEHFLFVLFAVVLVRR